MAFLRKSDPKPSPQSPPNWAGRGPWLSFHLYFALLVHTSLLIWAVYGQVPEHLDWMKIAWGLTVGSVLLLALLGPIIQDWYSALSAAGRTFYFFAVFAVFWIPMFYQGHSPFPEGFTLALPLLIFIAVSESTMRAAFGFSIVGFWSACATATPPAPWLVAAFGFSTIWCFSCAHFLYLGEPYGLRGWWPFRKIWQYSLLYFVPAGGAALLAYFLWPDIPPPERAPEGPPAATFRQVGSLDAEQFMQLAIRLGIWFLLIVIALLVVYYIRKRLGRRARPADMPTMLGAEVSRLEIVERVIEKVALSLTGPRGKIVRMWDKWAREADPAEGGRPPSETAAELASRLERESGDITEIMERAHYGSEEPTGEDVKAMKEAVRRDSAAAKG